MKLFAVLTSLVYATATSPEGFTTLLLHTCENEGLFLPEHDIHFGLDFSLASAVANVISKTATHLTEQQCPNLSPGDIPKLNLLENLGIMLGAIDTQCDFSDMDAIWNSCPTESNSIVRNLDFRGCVETQWSAIHKGVFDMPSTCNRASWDTEGTCAFEVNTFEQMNIRVSVQKCTGQVLPAFKMECVGEACKTLMMPCAADSECKGGHKCVDFLGVTQSVTYGDIAKGVKEMLNELIEWWSTTADPNCNEEAGWGVFREFVKKISGVIGFSGGDLGAYSATNVLKFCMDERANSGDNLSQELQLEESFVKTYDAQNMWDEYRSYVNPQLKDLTCVYDPSENNAEPLCAGYGYSSCKTDSVSFPNRNATKESCGEALSKLTQFPGLKVKSVQDWYGTAELTLIGPETQLNSFKTAFFRGQLGDATSACYLNPGNNDGGSFGTDCMAGEPQCNSDAECEGSLSWCECQYCQGKDLTEGNFACTGTTNTLTSMECVGLASVVNSVLLKAGTYRCNTNNELYHKATGSCTTDVQELNQRFGTSFQCGADNVLTSSTCEADKVNKLVEANPTTLCKHYYNTLNKAGQVARLRSKPHRGIFKAASGADYSFAHGHKFELPVNSAGRKNLISESCGGDWTLGGDAKLNFIAKHAFDNIFNLAVEAFEASALSCKSEDVTPDKFTQTMKVWSLEFMGNVLSEEPVTLSGDLSEQARKMTLVEEEWNYEAVPSFKVKDAIYLEDAKVTGLPSSCNIETMKMGKCSFKLDASSLTKNWPAGKKELMIYIYGDLCGRC
jgi:hypothetical protein